MPDARYADDCLETLRAQPWRVMRIVRRDLVGRGFEVQTLARDDSQCLTVKSAGWARCVLSIEDDCSVHWECKPAAGPGTEPGLLVQLIIHVLAADSVGGGSDLVARPGATLKSVVGRALDARGVDVRLDVYQDTVCYEVDAQIVAVNLRRPERGQVQLSDYADIVWEWSCREAFADDASDIAGMIVAVLVGGIPMLEPSSGPDERPDPALLPDH